MLGCMMGLIQSNLFKKNFYGMGKQFNGISLFGTEAQYIKLNSFFGLLLMID